MDYAVIDVGSNTITLAIYRYENMIIKRILKEKITGALASYVKDGFMNKDGIKVACDSIKQLHESASKLVSEDNIFILATAAIRNSSNCKAILEEVKVRTGVELILLSGNEEAKYSFAGADYYFHGIIKEGIMIDIGGGSCELVLFEDSKPLKYLSLPIGSMSLYANFIKGIIPTDKERKAIKHEINKFLKNVDWAEDKVKNIIGVGGTLRNYLKLEKYLSNIDDGSISLNSKKIAHMLKDLKGDNDDIYKVVSKKIPDRIFTIYPGLMILNEVIDRFNCKRIYFSDFGVREGYLLHRIEG
jgi:exopolyphosphatase/guanosine-5'-triphosphate,3'-diphosphate pyrophosphatase